MKAALLLAATLPTGLSCSTALDCSLNGECAAAGVCVCSKPWTGDSCGVLAYKTTAASAKSLYNISDPRNTWNGPIAGPDAGGKFHIYDPIYRVKSLGGPTSILHGVADAVVGPWDWNAFAPMPLSGGAENPAYLRFMQNSTTPCHSLWLGGKVRVASTLDGPFTEVDGFAYPGGNPAPLWHAGSFYLTNQHTTQVFRLAASTLEAGAQWTVFANISHANVFKKTVPEGT